MSRHNKIQLDISICNEIWVDVTECELLLEDTLSDEMS